MVFVRNYGYNATTGTYLVVAGRLALCTWWLRSTGVLSGGSLFRPIPSRPLLLAEFACAAALISMGAIWDASGFINMRCWPLWRCRRILLNEWLVLDGGLGVTKGFVE